MPVSGRFEAVSSRSLNCPSRAGRFTRELANQLGELSLDSRFGVRGHSATVMTRFVIGSLLGTEGEKMGSRQVDVRVVSGDREVATAQSRPVRLLPDGSAGVVFGGEVYPLYPGDYIEISDPTYDKYDCMQFVAPGQPIPYARRGAPAMDGSGVRSMSETDWYVESNRFGHYVVFNATEADAEVIVDALDDELGVRRWDASHRPADNGQRYDWFARLSAPAEAGKEVVTQQVRAVLTGGGSGVAAAPVAVPAIDVAAIPESQRAAILSVLTQALTAVRDNQTLTGQNHALQGRLDELSQHHAELQAKHAAVTDELALTRGSASQLEQRLREQLASITADTAAEARVQRTELKKLAKENKRLRSLLSQMERAATETQTAEALTRGLQRELEEQRRRSDSAEEAWLEAESEKQDLTEKISALELDLLASADVTDRLTTDNQNLKAQLQEVLYAPQEARTRRRESTRARDRRRTVEGFIDNVLDRVDLDDESVETLLAFKKPARAFRYLTMIANGESIEGIDHGALRGYDGWREITNIHIGDPGAEDMGRIYYHPTPDGVKALIHKKRTKDEQRRYLHQRIG